MKNENRGGKREGSGRKQKYKEATVTVAFRVPESKAEQIKTLVNKKLDGWKNKVKKV